MEADQPWLTRLEAHVCGLSIWCCGPWYVCLCGCLSLAGVGKSSILLRFTDDVFDDVAPTIGVDFKVKALDVDGRRVKITAWDTGTSFSLLLWWVSRLVSTVGDICTHPQRRPIRLVRRACIPARAPYCCRPLCCAWAPLLRSLHSGARF